MFSSCYFARIAVPSTPAQVVGFYFCSIYLSHAEVSLFCNTVSQLYDADENIMSTRRLTPGGWYSLHCLSDTTPVSRVIRSSSRSDIVPASRVISLLRQSWKLESFSFYPSGNNIIEIKADILSRNFRKLVCFFIRHSRRKRIDK